MRKICFGIIALFILCCSPEEEEIINIIENNVTPSIPNLISPANLSTVTLTFVDELVKFEWEESIGDFNPNNKYSIEVSEDQDFNTFFVQPTETNQAEFFLSNTNVTYYWRVRSLGVNGVSLGYSEVWSFFLTQEIVEDAPSAPVLISPADQSILFTTSSSLQVVFEWNEAVDPNNDVTGYTIQLSKFQNFSNILESINTNNLTYTDNFSDLNENIYWRVQANDAENNQSPWSEVWSFSIEQENSNDVPDAPVLISPSNQSTISTTSNPAQINFEWNEAVDPNSDVSEYNIQLSTFQDFSNIQESDITNNLEFSYTINNLNDTFFWRVQAIDTENNESPWSEVWSFDLEDLSAPSEPILLFPSDGEDCQVANLTLDWEDSIDPNGLPISYEVYISDTPNIDSSAQIFSTNVSEYTVTLDEGQAYYWQVVASNGNSSSESEVFSFYAQGDPSVNTVPYLSQRAPASGFVTDSSFINLEMQVGDAETSLDDLSMDIYFGTDQNNLPTVATGLDGTTFNIQVQMPNATNYYWKIHVTDTDGATYVSQVWSIVRE